MAGLLGAYILYRRMLLDSIHIHLQVRFLAPGCVLLLLLLLRRVYVHLFSRTLRLVCQTLNKSHAVSIRHLNNFEFSFRSSLVELETKLKLKIILRNVKNVDAILLLK
jgi:hypothetical protein